MLSMSAKGAFRVLDISEGATPDEIKNAYRIMALKYHPNRHHNSHNKEAATRYFLEVTEAYRTLVREGHVKHLNTSMAKSRPEPPPPPPVRRPPPMAHKNSSESSISLDSFVHMVASSSETLTTPASSKRESPRSSWKQGVRKPAEAVAAQYRNGSTQPHLFSYEAPPRNGTKGPALYTAPPSFISSPLSPPPQAQASKAIPKISIPSKDPPQNAANAQSKYRSALPPTSANQPKNNLRQSMNGPIPNANSRVTTSNHKQPQPPIPNLRNQIPPYAIPLLSIGLGPAGEWAYSLSLTLEELFIGKHFRFGITRSYLSNKTKNVVIEIDIPAGCRPGTRILCRNVGHEWQPGHYQDIAFVIEEVPHDRFVRLFDDLIMDVRLPWVDSLRRQGGKVPFIGIDGRNLGIQIDYPGDKNMKGRSVIKGAGMPVRERGQVVGKGNLIVQWEILPPKTKILHFMRRLWGGK